MPRRMNTEDKTLWRFVTRNVARLHKSLEAEPEDDIDFAAMMAPPPKPPAKVKGTPDRPKQTLPPALSGPPSQDVDLRTLAKFKRGQMPIEATIDLHGHRLHEAYDALRGFVRLNHERERRCVLVIHGKGLLTGDAKIKNKMPQWLAELPDIVLAHAPAKPEHGGGGASYILLRRKRVTNRT